MRILLQSASMRPRHSRSMPRWMQVMAAVCLLLVAWTGVVQASHMHGVWSPQSGAVLNASTGHSNGPSNSADNDLTCPVCVAMHLGLPGAMVLALAVSGLCALLGVEFAERFIHTLSTFSLFSRPPPFSV